jgi:hypothetical protein
MIQPRSPLGLVLISAFDICDFFFEYNDRSLRIWWFHPGDTSTPGKIARMWVHEVTRVFVDRIVDPTDLTTIGKKIAQWLIPQ